MENLEYDDIRLQRYLNHSSINPQLAQNMFRWRTRMFNFKKNFSNGNDDVLCIFGCDSLDSQEHSLNCQVIKTKLKDLPYKTIQYSQLFSNYPSKIKDVVTWLNKAYEVRELLLEKIN